MIEVDVFWSFAFGASFAAAASRQLAHERSIFVNIYFVYTLLFLSLLFVPSGAYLLAAFPSWESMYVLNRATVSRYPSLPTLFAFTNVLLGVMGYTIAALFARRRWHFLMHFTWTSAYVAFAGILGCGYRRFFYPDYYDESPAGVAYTSFHSAKPYPHSQPLPVLEFLSSHIFYTLLAMGVVILPAVYLPIYSWLKAGLAVPNPSALTTTAKRTVPPQPSARDLRAKTCRIVTLAYLLSAVLGAGVWVGLVFASPLALAHLRERCSATHDAVSSLLFVGHSYPTTTAASPSHSSASTRKLFDPWTYLVDPAAPELGPWAPLVGYACAQLVVFVLVIAPFLIVPLPSEKPKRT